MFQLRRLGDFVDDREDTMFIAWVHMESIPSPLMSCNLLISPSSGGSHCMDCGRTSSLEVRSWYPSMGRPGHTIGFLSAGESSPRGGEALSLISKQWANVSEILYPPLVAITRLSICLQFIHIFVLNRDKKFWYLHIFIWVNIMYFTVFFFVTIFQCTPRAKIWDPELPGTCLRYQAYSFATGVFNVVSDFLMLGFPIVCIWNLQMSIKRKVGVSAIFFVGSL